MRTRSMLGEQLEYPEYPKTDEYPEPPKVALRCPAQARKGPWVLPSTQRVSSDYPISTHRVPRVPKGGRAPRSIGASVLSARKGLRALPSTRRVHSKYPREYSEYPVSTRSMLLLQRQATRRSSSLYHDERDDVNAKVALSSFLLLSFLLLSLIADNGSAVRHRSCAARGKDTGRPIGDSHSRGSPPAVAVESSQGYSEHSQGYSESSQGVL